MKTKVEEKGLVFDIQGHSVHDGPGSRTLVFLAGCPLRCEWCANPEGMEFRQKIRYLSSKCVGCLRCVQVCPKQAISVEEGEQGEKLLKINRDLCSKCETLDCAKACLNEAIVISGRWMTVAELLGILRRDRKFWGPKGGVTFSGGEPLFQKNFILQALKKCREAYIHTGIETSAYVETDFFLKALSYVEFAFIDIKNMDTNRHKEKTRVHNELILKNIEALASSNWPGRLIIRTVIIEGFSDNDENIIATADFLKKVGLDEINILPFHRLGDSKWTQLGKRYKYRDQREPSEEKMKHIQQLFLDRNIACYIGYSTPF